MPDQTPITCSDPRIRLGNQQGRHFEPRKFKLAIDIAGEVLTELGGVEMVEVDYDAAQDFTHLRFTRNGHRVDVQFYKVLAVSFDAEAGQRAGFNNHPRWWPSDSDRCTDYIRRHTDNPLPDPGSPAPEADREGSQD